MFENLLNAEILTNPILLALLIAIIRNIGGYLEAVLSAKGKGISEKYDLTKLGSTVATYETVFIALSQVPSLPTWLIAVLAVAVDISRSVKNVIKEIPATIVENVQVKAK